jgi:hypothetical protein
MTEIKLRTCPDCAVEPGQCHIPGCDMGRCPSPGCNGQAISCGCGGEYNQNLVKWTGLWPGKQECRDRGWYAKFNHNRGWQKCSAEDPEAREDLNRWMDAGSPSP